MFKIALIGCGDIARRAHAPAMQEYAATHADTELVACCDIRPEVAQACAETFGFQRFYTDYLKMIECEKPDVACVITPVAITADVAEAVIKTGTNVTVEKPPAPTSERIMKLHKLANEYGVSARALFNRRYMPLVGELKNRLENQEILNLACDFVRVGRRDTDFPSTAVHAIDSIRHLAGSDYKKIDFIYHDCTLDDAKVTNFFLSCSFENGASAQIAFVPTGGRIVERITVNTVGRSFDVKLPVWGGFDSPGELMVCEKDKLIDKITAEDAPLYLSNGFYEENASYFDFLRAPHAPKSDLDTAAQIIDIENHMRARAPYYIKGETHAL